MAFNIDIGFASLAGRKTPNEDFCAAMLPGPGEVGMGSIVAIADGVSHGGMGREAAQTSVTSLVRDYYGTPETWDTTVALDRIISAQNAWLAGLNHKRRPLLGLTTLTALVLRGQSYTLAHVGDTRAYLLRAGELTQLTIDHAVDHPDLKHQLLRVVGADHTLVVDYAQGDLQVGDVFVLLSDGVHNVLPDKRLRQLSLPAWPQTIAAANTTTTTTTTTTTATATAAATTIATTPGGPPAAHSADVGVTPASTLEALTPEAATTDAQALSRQLVDAALSAGSRDNVTAMVVRVLGLLDATLNDENRLANALPMPPRFKVRDTIDGLSVTAPVADNGINVLYQVRDSHTQRLYALKTLHPARAADPAERAMLAHEAWLARRMQSSSAAHCFVQLHPGPPNGQSASAFYLLYDWHGGETLQQLLDRQHRFSVPQTLAVGTQVVKALGLLHRQGVIHRDIKPANLHQGEDGVLRVLDLGVALSGREPAAMRSLHAGTPSYINPEQWGFGRSAGVLGKDAPVEDPDAQSDLFALGVTLYQLLTGKLPYGEVLPYQAGRYWRDPVAPSRHNPEVPIWLDHIVLKAVGRDKRLRFETAEEMLLAIERGASRPLSAPPATPLIHRNPADMWKFGLGVSLLFNALLVVWLLFLPK